MTKRKPGRLAWVSESSEVRARAEVRSNERYKLRNGQTVPWRKASADVEDASSTIQVQRKPDQRMRLQAS